MELNRPAAPVFLENIAQSLEETMDGWEQYLNLTTGEIEATPDGTYLEPDAELLQKIEDRYEEYIRLPNQYELHEYRIMENFADAFVDTRKRARLIYALRGKKPYRHFKDELNRLGLVQAYDAFRFLAFVEIAREWCEDHGVPYQTHGAK